MLLFIFSSPQTLSISYKSLTLYDPSQDTYNVSLNTLIGHSSLGSPQNPVSVAA